jgi:hypothetical protein
VPALVDTTVRLLSQEPLAGRLSTASILELAEVLDGAGFAALEVSGGGVFDSAARSAPGPRRHWAWPSAVASLSAPGRLEATSFAGS